MAETSLNRVNVPLETVTRLIHYFNAHYADISLGYEVKLARRYFFQPDWLKTEPLQHRLAKKTARATISADN